jgi:integrase
VYHGFAKTYFPKDVNEAKRKPIPIEDIRRVQNLCMSMDDDLRWLVALISDSGMRLGEAVGLLKADICLDSDIAHLILKPHPWRSLKTRGSQRAVPLISSSLWAAKRLSESNAGGPICFLTLVISVAKIIQTMLEVLQLVICNR